MLTIGDWRFDREHESAHGTRLTFGSLPFASRRAQLRDGVYDGYD